MHQYTRKALAIAAVTGLAVSGSMTWSQAPAPAGTPSISEEKAAQQCQENLMKIDGAKEQFALEYKKKMSTVVTWPNLLDPDATGQVGNGYLKRKPACPSGGHYEINPVGVAPTCSLALTSSTLSTTTTQYHSRHALPD